MKHIEKAIREHYAKKQLSDSAMDRIIALGEEAKHSASEQNSSTQNKDTSKFGWSQVNNWQVASLVFFTAIIIGVFIGKSDPLSSSINQLVLEEIAMNHNKRLTVEYPIKEYPSLRTAMARLDFDLVQPKLLSTNYQLVGGRYCSIQGRLAAQLKIQDIDNGDIATLYVTPITTRLSDISNQETVADNVNIRLWKADNFLYGLATDPLKKYSEQ